MSNESIGAAINSKYMIEKYDQCVKEIKNCPKANGYAKAYAINSSELLASGHTAKEAIPVQCLYILNNIGSWRGPNAKTTRFTLKSLSKRESRS